MGLYAQIVEFVYCLVHFTLYVKCLPLDALRFISHDGCIKSILRNRIDAELISKYDNEFNHLVNHKS